MNRIVNIIIGVVSVSLLVVLGLLLEHKVFYIQGDARRWEFWSLYGLTMIVGISQWLGYQMYVDLRNSSGLSGKHGERGKRGQKGFKGKCVWE